MFMSTEMEKNQAHVRYSAEAYDAFTATFVRAFDDLIAERIVEEVGGRQGLTLLDVGTGTARLLVHLAGLPALDGVRFIGTDVFDDMVDRARETVRAAGLEDQITLAVDDVVKVLLEFSQYKSPTISICPTCKSKDSTLHRLA